MKQKTSIIFSKGNSCFCNKLMVTGNKLFAMAGYCPHMRTQCKETAQDNNLMWAPASAACGFAREAIRRAILFDFGHEIEINEKSSSNDCGRGACSAHNCCWRAKVLYISVDVRCVICAIHQKVDAAASKLNFPPGLSNYSARRLCVTVIILWCAQRVSRCN